MNDRMDIDNYQQKLIDETQAIWDQKAAWWDAFMGDDGNDFHRDLIRPPVEKLLALQPDELVLDAACGNGLFARRMASQGAQVVAFDGSQVFLDSAQARGGAENERIDYRLVDATHGYTGHRAAIPGDGWVAQSRRALCLCHRPSLFFQRGQQTGRRV